MYLTELAINHFRCLNQSTINPSPTLNLILGENGEGKTSVLEAIFCLSRGRSFRAKQLKKLIQDEQSSFLVRSKLHDDIQQTVALQVSRGTSSKESSESGSEFIAKINGQAVKTRIELNRVLPSILLDPSIHKLIEEGPSLRRQFLDWGVFHVEPQFIHQWRRYQRALKQRNTGLKKNLSYQQLNPWDEILLESGEFIHHVRQDYLAHIAVLTQNLASELLKKEVKFSYRAGWPAGQTLAQALENSRPREQQLGSTVVGPHRADMIIHVGGEKITQDDEFSISDSEPDQYSVDSNKSKNETKFHRAKHRVSRGQQKLLACALMLAQAEHYKELSGKAPLLLIDDPFAELDNRHAATLLEKIAAIGAQCFITALNPLDHPLFINAQKFHVEHGCIKEYSE